MKRQIILIHGGNTYDSYEQYIATLKKIKLDFKRALSGIGWRGSLQEELGKKFEVIAPRMPNSLNAKYLEWDIWFKKFIPYLNDDIVLIGHSLGGIFLAKYLSENPFSKKISGIFLVSASSTSKSPKESLADFILPKDMSRLADYGEKVHLYYSTDDKLVHLAEFKKYVKALPKAHARLFKDRGHFSGKTFPELVKDIKALYKK